MPKGIRRLASSLPAIFAISPIAAQTPPFDRSWMKGLTKGLARYSLDFWFRVSEVSLFCIVQASVGNDNRIIDYRLPAFGYRLLEYLPQRSRPNSERPNGETASAPFAPTEQRRVKVLPHEQYQHQRQNPNREFSELKLRPQGPRHVPSYFMCCGTYGLCFNSRPP